MNLLSIAKKRSRTQDVVTHVAMSAQKALRLVVQLNWGARCCDLLCLFSNTRAAELAKATPHIIPSWTGCVDASALSIIDIRGNRSECNDHGQTILDLTSSPAPAHEITSYQPRTYPTYVNVLQYRAHNLMLRATAADDETTSSSYMYCQGREGPVSSRSQHNS